MKGQGGFRFLDGVEAALTRHLQQGLGEAADEGTEVGVPDGGFMGPVPVDAERDHVQGHENFLGDEGAGVADDRTPPGAVFFDQRTGVLGQFVGDMVEIVDHKSLIDPIRKPGSLSANNSSQTT